MGFFVVVVVGAVGLFWVCVGEVVAEKGVVWGGWWGDWWFFVVWGLLVVGVCWGLVEVCLQGCWGEGGVVYSCCRVGWWR